MRLQDGDTWVSEIFQGSMCSTVKKAFGGPKKRLLLASSPGNKTYSIFNTLQLNMKGASSVDEAFQLLTTAEEVPDWQVSHLSPKPFIGVRRVTSLVDTIRNFTRPETWSPTR